MTQYQAIFSDAFSAYQEQRTRPGFKKGYFTSFRHSAILYPAIAKLQELLLNTQSDEVAQNILIKHLSNTHNKNNQHSFNSYLLDRLLEKDNNLDWSYFVKNKVKNFTGILYRGMARNPEQIFNQGLSCNQSSEVLIDYIKRKNDRVGISTSKSYETALDYALKRLNKFFFPPDTVYVYKINYRGCAGLDVNFSNEKNMFLDFIYKAQWKNEVNVASTVLPQDIMGADEIRKNNNRYIKTWIPNPNYMPHREHEVSTQVELRKKIFA